MPACIDDTRGTECIKQILL